MTSECQQQKKENEDSWWTDSTSFGAQRVDMRTKNENLNMPQTVHYPT